MNQAAGWINDRCMYNMYGVQLGAVEARRNPRIALHPTSARRQKIRDEREREREREL
jgi:hypothetical protein